jgi:pyruvate-formate lyase-activating enzyme
MNDSRTPISRLEDLAGTPHAILGLYLTNRCNVRCRHCSSGSGPGEPEEGADLEQVLDQVPALVLEGVVRALHVSGGEPFLYVQKLARIASVGRRVGLPVAVNTNAFWAPTLATARSRLMSLPGVTELFIGTDEYHEEFLPLERAITAAVVAAELNLHVTITVCTPMGLSTPLVDRLSRSLQAAGSPPVTVRLRPVEAAGRAVDLPEAQWRKPSTAFPEGACALLNRPVVMETGHVGACCNTTAVLAAGASPLKRAHVSGELLTNILSSARSDPILQAIHLLGPAWLATTLPIETQRKLTGSYPERDICSLCTDMMSRAEVVDEAYRVLASAKQRTVLQIAGAIAGVARAG